MSLCRNKLIKEFQTETKHWHQVTLQKKIYFFPSFFGDYSCEIVSVIKTYSETTMTLYVINDVDN